MEELTIATPQLRLAARAFGAASGRPVLGLHGWLDNAATFDRLAPLLPEGLRLVSLDQAGHGRSERRGEGVYHFIDYVADAIAAADALGWGRFSLLGHSLGAGVAALVAGAIPERIERLVMLEGLGPWTDAAAAAPATLRAAMEADVKPPRLSGRGVPDLEAAAQIRKRAGDLSLEAARTLMSRGVVAGPEGLVWAADPRLRAPSRLRLTEAQVVAFLGAIACPTMIVRASRGWPVDPAMEAARVAAIRGVTVARVDGGHHVHLDHPEAVAAAVSGFLH